MRDRVRVAVVYYYETSPPDVDNFHKPIQDALQGIVYENDRQVSDAAPSKREVNGSFRVRGMSAVLAEGFVSDVEFLYIRVEPGPDEEEVI